MPKKIFLIRHGETEYNKENKVQGQLDTLLNSTGIKQAQLLAKRLQHEPIDAIISSDLRRPFDTIKPLADLKHLAIETTKDLRERHLGIFQDKTWDEVKELYPKLVEKLDDQYDFDWKGHQGESRSELHQRVDHFITYLQKQYLDKIVVIATHGGPKRALLHGLGLINQKESAGKKHLNVGNTSVSIIEKDNNNKYQLTLFNDTSHLKEMES